MQKTRTHVAILMASYNGARFLRDQLDSIAAQDHDDWSLHVSDDGSHDPTLGIVAAFARDHPGRRIVWRKGPARAAPRTSCRCFATQQSGRTISPLPIRTMSGCPAS